MYSASIEHRGTFLNHVKTFGWAEFNTVNETIDDIKIAKDYVCAAVSSLFDKDAEYNYLSDIEDLKEDKERINEFCKDKSPYEADNSIINIAMAVDGIGSIFSAPKNAFKAGEALVGGVKVVGASGAVIDMTKISEIALEGVGSAALSIARALEAGAGIYNMSGGSDSGKSGYIKEERVPLDRETVLSNDEYVKTKMKVKGASVYKKGDRYYYRDTLHKGERAHLEVFDKKGIHLGEANPLNGELIANTADKRKKLKLK